MFKYLPQTFLATILIVGPMRAFSAASSYDSFEQAKQASEPEKQIKLYTKALELWVPEDGIKAKGAILESRGTSRLAIGQRSEALKDFNDAIKANPSEWVSYHSQGQVLALLGRCHEAVEAQSQAIRLAPAHDAASQYDARAAVREQCGQLRGALDDINKAMSLAKNSKDRYALVSSGTLLANILCRQKKYRQAMTQFADTVKECPGCPWIYYDLGKCQQTHGSFDAAMTSFTEAISLAVGTSGRRRIELSELETVRPGYNSIAITPEYLADSYFRRAQIYDKKGEVIFAHEDFHEACQLKLKKACRPKK